MDAAPPGPAADTAANNADTRWAGPAADRLNSVPLDSLTAVFDRAAGQTHLLAAPLPEILAALAQGPADAAAIAARLALQFDLDGTGDAPGGAVADVTARISERLEELATLGLITPGLR